MIDFVTDEESFKQWVENKQKELKEIANRYILKLSNYKVQRKVWNGRKFKKYTSKIDFSVEK